MMEDQANNFFSVPADPQAVAMVSIAISLKRIADAVDPPDKNINGTFLQRLDNCFYTWLGSWRDAR